MTEITHKSRVQEEAQQKDWRTAVESAAQIGTKAKSWLTKYFDLPTIALILNPLRKLTAVLAPDSHVTGDWKDLKREGERLSRSRVLFVAAEATGQLAETTVTKERVAMRDNLGVLIREGTSLHKVRALRALRFLASEECIPHIEQGLRDSSAWVQATS